MMDGVFGGTGDHRRGSGEGLCQLCTPLGILIHASWLTLSLGIDSRDEGRGEEAWLSKMVARL